MAQQWLKINFSLLRQCINKPSSDISSDDYDPIIKAIFRKIDSQRTDYNVFTEDDGIRQLKSLQTLLLNNDYEDYAFPNDLYEKLVSNDNSLIKSVFEKYKKHVEYLNNQFIPHEVNEFEEKQLHAKDVIETIASKISKLSRGKNRDFYEILRLLIDYLFLALNY